MPTLLCQIGRRAAGGLKGLGVLRKRRVSHARVVRQEELADARMPHVRRDRQRGVAGVCGHAPARNVFVLSIPEGRPKIEPYLPTYSVELHTVSGML